MRFYAITAILALFAIASIATLNVIVIATGFIVSAMLIAFYKLHYIIEAVIFRRTNLIEVVGNCELGGERTVAIRKLNGRYFATAAALLKNRISSGIDREKVESIIANSKCAFRFVMQVEHVDINKLLDRLHTARTMTEIELGRIGTGNDSSQKAASLKRKIEQLGHEIDSIGSSGAPLKVSQYIITGAVSESRQHAQELAKSQIRELSSEFGALLGSESEPLSGNDLLELMEFDSMVV